MLLVNVPERFATLLAFSGGVLAGELVRWIRSVDWDPCFSCGKRFCDRKTCPRFDPHLGKDVCPRCGETRHLFARRPAGPVECWKCRGEPDPEGTMGNAG